MPYAIPVGMVFSLAGVLLMSVAPTYSVLLLSVALIGCGSSVFHPQSSQAARAASGGRYGLAQSLFQIGGNFGQALGPMLAAVVVLRYGEHGRWHVAWFASVAILGIVILLQVSRWYSHHLELRVFRGGRGSVRRYPPQVVRRTIGVLFILMFSKFFYLASIGSYYEFFLIYRFKLSAHAAAYLLGVFLLAVAGGTLIGGPLGDRIGRKRVIWFSILGCAPFTLALPYTSLAGQLV